MKKTCKRAVHLSETRGDRAYCGIEIIDPEKQLTSDIECVTCDECYEKHEANYGGGDGGDDVTE